MRRGAIEVQKWFQLNNGMCKTVVQQRTNRSNIANLQILWRLIDVCFRGFPSSRCGRMPGIDSPSTIAAVWCRIHAVLAV